MLLPVLLIGVVAFLAGKAMAPSTPAIGALGPGAPARPTTCFTPGELCRLELGRPYRIVATSTIPPERLQTLITWLRLGTYRAGRVQWSQMPNGETKLCIDFVSPKTTTVPIGQPLDWDLGDGRLRLVLRQVTRLDGGPLTIGANGNRRIRELRDQARAELAMSRALGQPLGPLYARTMNRALDLQARGHARPSEVPRLFDDLRDEHGHLDLPGELHER